MSSFWKRHGLRAPDTRSAGVVADASAKGGGTAVNHATTESEPAGGFRLVRYFTLASFAAFGLVVAPLLYFDLREGDFFRDVAREHAMLFAQIEDDFVRRHDAAAHAALLGVREAGNVNLVRLFSTTLWNKDFASFVAKAQEISVDQCRAMADLKEVDGKTVQPDNKQACFAAVGRKIVALPGFKAIEANVLDVMEKTTVIRIALIDLRGITVYSSDHRQIGEDRRDTPGWRSAVAGKPASELIHRDKFESFAGKIESRDLISSYQPVRVPGSETVVGAVDIYSDVTPFLRQIKDASLDIRKLGAESRTRLEQRLATNQLRMDDHAKLLLAIILTLLALLYGALILIVRRGQSVIDKEMIEHKRLVVALRESEAHLRGLTEMSSDFYWQSDAEHRLTQRSESKREKAEGVFQRASSIGKRRWDIPYLLPDESGWQKHRAMLDQHLPFRDFEILRIRGNGALHYISASGDPVFDAAGEFTGYRGVGRDITDSKQAAEALRIAATAFESQEGMLVTDAAKFVLKVNRAFSEITGYRADEVVGKTPSFFGSDCHEADFYSAMWESIERNGAWQGEIRDRRKSGEVYPGWLLVTAVKDEAGQPTHYVVTFTDITARKAAEDQIKNLAFYDQLTKLPNRRLLSDRLSHAQAANRRSGCHGALMFLDMDNFKSLNDTYGHEVGDLLLIDAAQRIRTCVREMDTVARFGGDEFVVMISDMEVDRAASAAQAGLIAEKIRSVLSVPYVLTIRRDGRSSVRIEHQSTASIGVALFVNHETSHDDILKWADTAMYRAKEDGRNSIRFHDGLT